jgi:acyl-CoA thioester hydrolase
MPSFPQPEAWLAQRVSDGETDAMTVLYYAEYLHLFERGRGEYLRAIAGISYNKVEAKGILLPVRRAECRYRRPARYDDLLWIRVGISRWNRASLVFTYEIFNEDKSLPHAEGSTEHAVVNAQGRPVPVPDWLRDLFREPVQA